jgi:hypothetical protein
MDLQTFILLGAAVLGPFLTFVVAVRRISGKITTSEASDLWEESRDIRKEYRTRIAELEKENQGLRDTVQTLEDQRMKDRERIVVLERQVALLTGEDELPGHLT